MARNQRRGDRHARAEREARRRAHAGNANRPPTPAPTHAQDPSRTVEAFDALDEPELPDLVDAALNAELPLDLLNLASGMVAALEPPDVPWFDRVPGDDTEDDDPDLTLEELIAAFAAPARGRPTRCCSC